MKKLITGNIKTINLILGVKINVFAIFFILNLIALKDFSQNLVQNSSFENYTACPTSYSQINKCLNWFSAFNNNTAPDATDYMNTCGTNQDCSIPTNVWGNQTPKTGNAYLGMLTKATIIGSNYRENIYTVLTTALIPNKTYSLTMNVSLAENAKYASNNFGFKFSKVPNFPINNTSHFNSTSVVTNTSIWSVITGTFTADSAYTHLAIGNFYTDANTTETISCASCNLNVNYYYIDDVSVIKLGETTGIQNIKYDNFNLNLYPNPTNGIVNLNFSEGLYKISTINIYDVLGNQVKYFYDVKSFIDISELKSGIYYAKINIDGNSILKKIIKQ